MILSVYVIICDQVNVTTNTRHRNTFIKNKMLRIEKMECHTILTKYSKNIPFQQLKKKRNTDCQNKETLGGYPLYQFEENEIVKQHQRGKTYCFRPDEIRFLQDRNPYTNTYLASPDRNSQLTTTPLSQLTRKELCPLTRIGDTDKSHYVIVASVKPLSKIDKQLLIRDTNRLRETNETEAYKMVHTTRIFSKFYYLVRTKTPVREYEFLKPNNIASITKFIDRDIVSQSYTPSLQAAVKSELKKFFTYQLTKFSPKVLQTLGDLHLHLHHRVRAFRGLFFPNKKVLAASHMEYISKGDTVEIMSRGFPMSWSTDPCVSQFFATNEAARRHTDKDTVRYGILLSIMLDPDSILLDTRLIDKDFFLKQLYARNQDEIITKPYSDGKKERTFTCRVERLFLMDSIGRATVVMSFVNF